MRTFIAVELSDSVRQALADIQKTQRGPLPGARWTRPEGTHLTLKFLGEATAHQVAAISSALDEVAADFQPLELSLSKVGAFPRLSNPNVIWVGIGESAELTILQKAIDGEIAPLGFPTEKRPFRAHLTLARLAGQPWSSETRQRFLECSSICDGVRWKVERITLFRSDLKPSGAEYTIIHTSLLNT
jgi:2'-5' RNA ligase